MKIEVGERRDTRKTKKEITIPCISHLKVPTPPASSKNAGPS